MQRLRRAVLWLVLLPSIVACLAIWLLAHHSPWTPLGVWLGYPAILAEHVLVEIGTLGQGDLPSRCTRLLVFLPVTAVSYSVFFWPCYEYITTRKKEFLLLQGIFVFAFLCWMAFLWYELAQLSQFPASFAD